MESVVKNHKHEFWKEHIERWVKSGLSQPSYCATHQLKLTTFLYYRQRLNPQSQEKLKGIKFVSVSSTPALKSSQPLSGMQLQLPNGIRISICSNVSESLLQMVLKIAGQIIC
jgi:hypothetical protein